MAARFAALLIVAALLGAARGLRGAVAAGSGFATEAGMRMFHAGGNAVDAGVAAMLAAAVAGLRPALAPAIIRALPNQVLEAGADPYGYRAAEAW